MMTFVLMGVLCAVSATIRRLDAVTNLGVQNELDVIATTIIGGTSFAGLMVPSPGPCSERSSCSRCAPAWCS